MKIVTKAGVEQAEAKTARHSHREVTSGGRYNRLRRPTAHEGRQDPSGPEFRQIVEPPRRRSGARWRARWLADAKRSTGGHRCGVPGILEQLGGAGHAGQVDDALEVGGAAGAELPGEVFAADPQPGGDLVGPERLLDPRTTRIPGAQLERLGQAEHPRPVGEEAPARGAPAWPGAPARRRRRRPLPRPPAPRPRPPGRPPALRRRRPGTAAQATTGSAGKSRADSRAAPRSRRQRAKTTASRSRLVASSCAEGVGRPAARHAAPRHAAASGRRTASPAREQARR